jgi:hypothetical protein
MEEINKVTLILWFAIFEMQVSKRRDLLKDLKATHAISQINSTPLT